jgi:cytochrome c oxidase assembly factor CtaG
MPGLVLALVLLLAALVLPSQALAHGAIARAPQLPGILMQWRLEPFALAGVTLAGAGYFWAVRRIGRGHPGHPNPPRRSWFFVAGLLALVLALTSPIEVYEGQLFSVHMAQHMLLELVAAPLLLAGAPITLALRVASPSVRRRLLKILQSRVTHLVSFPIVAWVLFAAVNWGWHFSVLYDQALENPWLHYVEHASFLGAALLFWWPVLGVDPSTWRMPHPARLLYLFLAMPQNSFLGVALLSAGTVLYPHYVTNLRSWGPTPLDDQRLGGTLMWVGGDLAFLIAMALVLAGWMRYEDRRTARLDARLAAERAARGE